MYISSNQSTTRYGFIDYLLPSGFLPVFTLPLVPRRPLRRPFAGPIPATITVVGNKVFDISSIMCRHPAASELLPPAPSPADVSLVPYLISWINRYPKCMISQSPGQGLGLHNGGTIRSSYSFYCCRYQLNCSGINDTYNSKRIYMLLLTDHDLVLVVRCVRSFWHCQIQH